MPDLLLGGIIILILILLFVLNEFNNGLEGYWSDSKGTVYHIYFNGLIGILYKKEGEANYKAGYAAFGLVLADEFGLIQGNSIEWLDGSRWVRRP